MPQVEENCSGLGGAIPLLDFLEGFGTLVTKLGSLLTSEVDGDTKAGIARLEL